MFKCIKNFFISSSIILTISSCATITGNKIQALQVSTNVDGAVCTITNTYGQWTVETPGTVTVSKDSDNLQIICKKKGYKPASVSIESSHTNASTWGNIVLGGGIGYIVDRNSGAAFVYPGHIKVALEKE